MIDGYKPFLTEVGKKNQENDSFSSLLYFTYLSSCACHENRAYDSQKYFNNVSTFTIVDIQRLLFPISVDREMSY